MLMSEVLATLTYATPIHYCYDCSLSLVFQIVKRKGEQGQVQNRAPLNFNWNLTAKSWWVPF